MKLKAIVDTLEGVPAEFHSLYTEVGGKFELTGIEGMRTQGDVDRVQGALTKERKDFRDYKAKYAVLADLDPAEIRTQLDRIPELEIAAEGKFDDKKVESLVEQRIRSKLAPVERQLADVTKERDAALVDVQNLQGEKRQATIADSIRKAATKAGVVSDAVEDAIMLGERVFTVDEAGRVVTKDDVGVTPGIDAAVWFTEMQPKRQHWFGTTTGGGAGGSRLGGGAGGNNPFTAKNWNLTEQGRLIRENPEQAAQLAKSAGVAIGATKPAS